MRGFSTPVRTGLAYRSARNDRSRSARDANAARSEAATVEMQRGEKTSHQVIAAAARLRDAVRKLRFGPPVTHVYNPLDYAWAAHEAYLRRYANGQKRVVFLGMNPGPFGMAQTGVPFGEIKAVRDWLGIQESILQPSNVHPKRPVHGFDCSRTEISGQRLWKLFADRFGSAQEFFQSHFVVNYCPLAFMESSGCNRTPNKLPRQERAPLLSLCDQHLREVVAALKPEWLIGVGDFACKRAQEIFPDPLPNIARILHPSPASPAANANWAALVTLELQRLDVW
jgi:single-strand selective monofunctional uracil DNA glycosylase